MGLRHLCLLLAKEGIPLKCNWLEWGKKGRSRLSLFLTFVYVSVLSAGTSVYHLHAWYPMSPEEGIRCPGAEVTNSYASPMGVLRIEPSPLEESQCP